MVSSRSRVGNHVTNKHRGGARSSLRELSSVRLHEFLREPEAVFWTFVLPVLLAIGLGIAFRNKPADVVHVGVVNAGGGDSLVAWLKSSKALAVERVPTLDSGLASMRNGKIALVVEAPEGNAAVSY